MAQQGAPGGFAANPCAVALRDAVILLTYLDDLLYGYKETSMPAIAGRVNQYVDALKRAQETRHTVREKVPLELLERMERENVSPVLYGMEALERANETMKTIETRDAMLSSLRAKISEQLKDSESSAKQGEVGEVAAAAEEPPMHDNQAMEVDQQRCE